MSVPECFAIFKDVSVSIAACIAAYVAVKGLGTWQKELRGKASFDVARALVKSLYFLRDEISYCRSPFTMGHEFPDGYIDNWGKQTNEKEGGAWAHVYKKRWEPVARAAQAFDTAALEAEALWGNEIREQSRELRFHVRRLQVSIEDFISDKYAGGEHFRRDEDHEKKVKYDIHDKKSEENELSIKLAKSIEEIESIVRPHLVRM